MNQTVSSVSVWKNPDFVRLFSAVSIVAFGAYLDVFAVGVLTGYVWKTDPVWIGLVPVAYALPGILLGSVAGVLADRFDRKKIMILADLFIAGITFFMTRVSHFQALLTLIFIRSVFSAVFYPAQQALTKRLVPEDRLERAMTWNGITDQLARIVSPFLGAMLIAALSPRLCLMIKGVSNLASALLLSGIRNREDGAGETGKVRAGQTVWSDWKEGWRVVRRNRMILSTLVFYSVAMFVLQLVDSQFPVLFREIFPRSPSMMGWIFSMGGLGGLLGAAAVGRAMRLHPGWLLGGGLALNGAGFGAIGLLPQNPSMVPAFAIAFVAGAGIGVFLVAFQVLLQRETKAEAAGRVFGIQSSLLGFLLIAGPVAGGWMVEWFGARAVYAGAGFTAMFIGAAGILFRKTFWIGSESPDRARSPGIMA